MLYVAQAQGPTAQLGALTARFLHPDRDSLIVHKLDRLEIIDTVDGAKTVVPVHSSIAAVRSVHLAGHATASLIVLTTCQRLFVLSADPSATDASLGVFTSSSTSIYEPFGRLAEYQDIIVDPHNRCILVHAYGGLVRVVPLPGAAAAAAAASSSTTRRASRGAADESNEIDLDASYNVRLSTLNVLSLAFVPTSPSPSTPTPLSSAPVVAVVYASYTGHKVLATFTVDLADKELGDGPVREEVLADPGSELAIPLGQGVAVVGEESLTWYGVSTAGDGVESEGDKGKGRAAPKEESGAGARCRLPVSRVTAWTAWSDNRLLLGDLFGKLLFVTATLSDAGRVTSLSVEDLGDATSATSIVPVSPTDVYLSSRFGDSQVICLPSTVTDTYADADAMQDDAPATELALVQSYPSLAPILDFVVVGESSTSSSGYVVTCSGAYKTGSLRIVRTGVGLQELASLEVDGVQRLWSFATAAQDQLLVLGFFDETRVFKLVTGGGDGGGDDGDELDLEEVDLPFFDSASATLFAGVLAGGLVAQVTAQGVALDGAAWRPEGGKKKITAAAAREGAEYLAVAVEGGDLVILRAEGAQFVQVNSTTFQHDIAALAVSPSGQHIAVALWTSQEVHLVDLASSPLAPCATHRIDSTFLIRSLALTAFSSSTDGADTTLLAGLGDGTLVSLAVDLASGTFAASSSKAVALGKRPLQLTEIAHGDNRAVFAASDRPTIVSRSKDRLVYSSVNLAETHAVAPLPNGALALASAHALTLGQVGAIQQVDVRTVPLDEDEPRRIAHDAEARCFVVACARRDVDRETGETSVRGVIRLVGEDFTTRATLALESGEEAQSLTLAHASESGEALFVVGTTRAPASSDGEPTEGRLLVLRATVDGGAAAGGALEQVSETAVGGCPYAVVALSLAGAQGYVATAVNSQVGVWALGADGSLSLSATWGGAFVAYTLAAGDEGDEGTLVVGDALRSVTLLRYTAPASAPMQGRLDEVARDYRSRYMLGVAPLAGSGGELLGAETDLNLFTLARDEGAAREGRLEDAGVLEARGQWHLGEMVSRFRPGSLGQLIGDSSGAASAQLLYATSAGSLGVVASLSTEAGQVLSDVERNLRGVVGSYGGLSQEYFRSYKNDKANFASAGFIDGAFVEQFLDLTPEEQDAVVAGQSEPERLSVGRDEVARLIEEVARTH